MKKHLILLADGRTEFASEILQVLQSAGIVVSTCRLRGMKQLQRELTTKSQKPAPVAVVYPLLDSGQWKLVVQRTREVWPNLPLVACANASNPARFEIKTTLTRLGFNAVAKSPAQLPVLLRELEEIGPPDEQPKRFKPAPERIVCELPASMRHQQVKPAFDLIASLHFASDQKDAASLAVTGLATLLSADRWSLFIANQKSTTDAIELELLEYRPQESVDAKQNNSNADPATAKKPPTIAHEAVSCREAVRKTTPAHSVLAVPLVSKGRVYGVLEGLRARDRWKSFSRAETALLASVATPIAASLANSIRVAEAERLSLTDELTRLHNARYLRQFLVNEIKRARRFGSKVAALFLDLDDFKTINDLHGHLVGSHVLMEIAAVILPSVRDTDCVVRYGGDEFVIILPQTGAQEAILVSERIRGKIERHRFTGGRRLHISLSASIGVAVFPDDSLSPHQLVACADQAMYAAKAAQKNCVRLAYPSASTLADADVPGPEQFQRIPDQKFIS